MIFQLYYRGGLLSLYIKLFRISDILYSNICYIKEYHQLTRYRVHIYKEISILISNIFIATKTFLRNFLNFAIKFHKWKKQRKMENISSSIFHELSVLVWSGCYNKIPQTGWLKQQTLISHHSRGWKVQDQSDSRFSSW